MKPKHDKPPEIAPQPPEDAKMTGRKGGVKKPGTDVHNIRSSRPVGKEADTEAIKEREDVSERETERD